MSEQTAGDDAGGFTTTMVAEIAGVVTCATPCVPECPRHHDQEQKP